MKESIKPITKRLLIYLIGYATLCVLIMDFFENIILKSLPQSETLNYNKILSQILLIALPLYFFLKLSTSKKASNSTIDIKTRIEETNTKKAIKFSRVKKINTLLIFISIAWVTLLIRFFITSIDFKKEPDSKEPQSKTQIEGHDQKKNRNQQNSSNSSYTEKKLESVKKDSIKYYSITIFTQPVSADIFINDKFCGKSNTSLQLKNGEYNLRVEYKNIKYEEIIKVPKQNIVTINLQ